MKRSAAVLLALAAAAQVRAQPRRMECGVVYEGALSASTLQQPYTFNVAEPNDVIAVRVLSTATDPKFTVSAILAAPSGQRLAPRPTSAFESTGAEFSLAETGDYFLTVLAGNNAAPNGTYRVIRTRLKGPCASRGITCGTFAKGQIGGPATVDSYQFTAEAGDLMSVRFARTTQNPSADERPAAFTVAIYDPNGQVAPVGERNFAAFKTTGVDRLDLRTKMRGAYTLLVFESSNGLRSGTYSTGILRLNGGCRTRAGACGASIEGSITEPLAVDAYSIAAAAGEVYLLRRVATGGALRLAMEVYDPQGVLVPPAPSSDPTRYAFTAAAAGSYTVLMSDGDGTRSGDYTLSIARLSNPCNAQSLGCSSVVDGRVDGPVRMVAYSVPAQAGDVHLVRLLRNQTTNGFRPRLEIFDPQGNQVQVAATLDLTRTTFAATSAGEYTILASDGTDGTRTGGFSVSVARLNRPCNAAPLGCASLVRGAIDGPLRSGTYSYTAQAGESFTVRMLGAGGTLQETLEVYDPQGKPVGSAVPGNLPGVDVARPAAGVYTILAMDASRTPGTGTYAVQTFRTRGGCVPPAEQGAPVAGVITGPAPFSAFTLPARAGDVLLVRSASLSPGFNVAMDLYDAEGARVESGTFGVGGQAASAGDYTLVTAASDPRTTGQYLFTWQALNRPVNAPRLPCGGTVSAVLSPAGQFRYYVAGAAAGDLLKLLLTRVSDGFSPQVQLFDPDGRRLAGSGNEISRKAVAPGDYLVLVGPSTAAGETGAFALAMQKPNGACATQALACGQTVLRAAETAGQVDAFRFEAAAGQRAVLRVAPRAGNFSPYLELYDPAGNLLQSGAAQLARALPAAGAYTLLVRDRLGSGTGTYRAGLQREPDACPVDDGEAPTIRIERPTGGEVVVGGAPLRIAWQSDDNVDLASHEIRFSNDGCRTFPDVLAAGLSGTAQSYDWQVPANVTPSRTGCIRVIAADPSGGSASADSGPLALIGSGFEPNSTVTYEYDGLNRVSRALYPDGTVVWYQYDAVGNLVRTVVAGTGR